MGEIQVLPVLTRRERRLFLIFPWRIFKNDPLWVPPLLPDLAARIDPAHGAIFQHGEAQCFIAWREGQPAGTICAAEDRQSNEMRGRVNASLVFFTSVKIMP